MTRKDCQKARCRLITKVNHLRRDLQGYLKNLSIFEQKRIESIPIRDHKQIVKSFLELAEQFQTSLEEWSLADSRG